MNETETYHVSKLVDEQVWRIGCECLFNNPKLETCEEITEAILEAGKAKLYKWNTFSNETMSLFNEQSPITSFEDFCNRKVLSYPDNSLLTKAMLIWYFEEELRADYEQVIGKGNS